MAENLLTNAQASITIQMDSPEAAKVIYSALEPETHSAPSERATTCISVRNSELIIEVRANDLTAIRAAMNSFLAWASSCMKTIDITRNQESSK
jgi:tRNA threonylcarbamoyladenosine modification (KEOPS) complex  Pcc1 subunit